MRAKRESNKVSKTSKVRFIWNITTFIMLCSALAIVVFISLSKIKSFFLIRNVVFYGNKHLTDDELKALAGIHGKDSLVTASGKV